MKRLPISETLLIVGVLTVVILMPLLWKEPQKEIVDAQLEIGRIIQVDPIEAPVVAEKDDLRATVRIPPNIPKTNFPKINEYWMIGSLKGEVTLFGRIFEKTASATPTPSARTLAD